jgi:tetratricopeptide (TPR) repeat protein
VSRGESPGSGPTATGGPGWHIDPDTLLPVIDDEAAFRAAQRDDPALELLVLLWSGRPEAALPLARDLVGLRPTPRHRALHADVARDLGRTAEAIATYESIVAETAGTPREAVMTQHLGKAHWAAGNVAEAEAAFERALFLRIDAGAAEDLVASSREARDRARRALDGTAPCPGDTRRLK